MTDTLHFRYDEQSGKITGRYWGDDPPEAITTPSAGEEYASTPDFSHDSRRDLLRDAKDGLVPGEDYDPDEEEVIAWLYYNPDSDEFEDGEIYAEARVEQLDDND